jgi:hypothetical protein
MIANWCHQQESNLYLALRRHSFYPLNYGGLSWHVAKNRNCMRWTGVIERQVRRFSVVGHGKDQVHGALLARLGANREALRQVIKNIQRPQRA